MPTEELLPWVDGVGRSIKKMQVGVIYTVKHRGTYQVALRAGEKEEIRPILSGLYRNEETKIYKAARIND